MTDPKNQRRTDRVRVNRQFDSLADFIGKFCTDLSELGAFIRTEELLEVGTRFDLRFTVVTDQIETIEGVGRVARVSEDPRGMGVEFEELTVESYEAIRRLLDPATVRPVGGASLPETLLRLLAVG